MHFVCNTKLQAYIFQAFSIFVKTKLKQISKYNLSRRLFYTSFPRTTNHGFENIAMWIIMVLMFVFNV